MEEHIKEERDYLRIGIQEAYLGAEFALKYLEKGPERDDHLSTMESLVKNYCLLDHQLQVTPRIMEKLIEKENAKLDQSENSDDPLSANGTIPDYNQMLSDELAKTMKKVTVDKHDKFKDYKGKIKRLLNQYESTGDDEDLAVTDESNNLIDPISKTELVDPVISLKCHHRFSRKSVMEHLKTGRYASQCPYVGCREKFSAEDLEEDVITAQTLHRLQLQRQM